MSFCPKSESLLEHSPRASCLRVVPGLLLQPGQGMWARTKEKNKTNKKWNQCCNSWTERKYGSGRTAWGEVRPAEPAWGASHRDLRKGSQPGLQAEAGSFWAGALGRTGPVGCLGRAPGCATRGLGQHGKSATFIIRESRSHGSD